MMDKIKIRIPEVTLSILKKDAESFEIYHPDRTINLNRFLLLLIENYYLRYQEEMKRMTSLISDTLGVEDSLKVRTILTKISLARDGDKKKRMEKTLSIKPSKETESIFLYIESKLLKGSTISEFFRNMFFSYTALPQDKREQIIFKKQYDTLLKAIKEKKKAFFTLGTRNAVKQELPYQIVTSKEEMHCYLLSLYKGKAHCYRLSRIREVTVLEEKGTFTPEERAFFDRMILYGPQYHYDQEETPVRIRLTDQGKRMLSAFYVHRPVYSQIEGDIYTFEGSYDQILTYFSRFGKEAYVLSPDAFRKKMYAFYKDAYLFYQKEYFGKDLEKSKEKKSV